MKKEKCPVDTPQQTTPPDEISPVPKTETADEAAAPQFDHQMNELEEKLAAAEKQRDEYLDLAQRARAEFENYRRRNTSTRIEALEEGNRKAITAMLPVLDSIERTMDAIQELDDSYRNGVELVFRQMKDCLAALGLEEIPALGKPFDPNIHDAVMQAPATEEYPPGTVMMVMQTGYTVKGRVVRVSMVQVAQ